MVIKKKYLLFLKALFSIGLLHWLFKKISLDWSAVGSVLFSSSFIIAYGLIVLNVFGQAFRWLQALRLFSISLPGATALKVTLIGMFFQATTIGAMAGEAARSYYLKKETDEIISKSAIATIFDRLVGLFTMSALSVFFGLWFMLEGPPYVHVQLLVAISLGCMIIVITALLISYFAGTHLLPTQIRELAFIKEGRQMIIALASQPFSLLQLLVVSILSNVLLVWALLIFANALGVPARFEHSATMLGPIILANSLPISIGGLGVGETVAQGVFQLMNLSNGAAVMLLIRLSSWSLAALGGFFYLFHYK